MIRLLSVCIILMIIASCRDRNISKDNDLIGILQDSVVHAQGFSITNYPNYKEIKVTASLPGATDTLHYILYPKHLPKPKVETNAIFIKTPVRSIVVTSTTDIPMLEALAVDSLLIGFPQTQYISSTRTKNRVASGAIAELGNEQNINLEALVDLSPDLVVGFSTSGKNTKYELLKRSGIPTVINGSWLEQHPLGRTEWIKFIGAFFDKGKKATEVFNSIKKEYDLNHNLVRSLSYRPTILPGSLYKDVWYVPGGQSYMATFYKDAGLQYAWENTAQTGSLSLSLETVIEKAHKAELWVTTKTVTTLKDLYAENSKYELFTSFQNKNVYSTFSNTNGIGTDFYELGSLRPDLILKDLIKIGHPQILPNHDLYFFKKLN